MAESAPQIWYKSEAGSYRVDPIEIVRETDRQVVFKNQNGTLSRMRKDCATWWVCPTEQEARNRLITYWTNELSAAEGRAWIAQQALRRVQEDSNASNPA